MNIVAEQNAHSPAADEPALRLDASLQIKDVEAERHLLAQLLGGTAPMRIDVSGLVQVDTAGVQLLLVFKQEAARRGVSLEFCGESQALRDALGLLGLTAAVLG